MLTMHIKLPPFVMVGVGVWLIVALVLHHFYLFAVVSQFCYAHVPERA